jgi:glycogen(starch) synthase
MNILYLCDEYPPGQHGGIGTSVQSLARQMARLGHNVVVAGFYSPGYKGDSEFDDQGIKVYRFRWLFDMNRLKTDSFLFKAANRILKETGLMDRDIKRSLVSYKQQLEKIITDHKIDIVEMPDYNDYVRFCRSYIPFPILSVPVIVKLHGSITYFNTEAAKQTPEYIFKMEQTILNRAAAVASVSNYTAVKSAQYLAYPHGITVLHNGIDTGITTPDANKKPGQVIFTGTLVTKKGIYQLAKAWNIVSGQMPAARLIILGKGNQKKVIDCLNEASKNTVTFLGHVDKDALYDHLSASAISVFSSYAEAFALAPLEAMVCGTAVINSNCTSGPELIEDKVDGLLVNPDDPDEIATAILYVLNNPDVCARLATQGNKKVKALFDIGIITEQNILFYNSVLNNNATN